MRRRELIWAGVAAAAITGTRRSFGSWPMNPLHAGYPGQHIADATRRWLTTTYPSSADNLSSFLFGSGATSGYVTLDELEASSKHYAPFANTDGSLASCTLLTIAPKIDDALAILGGPPSSASRSLSLLALSPMLSGKNKAVTIPSQVPADRKMLTDATVSAVINQITTVIEKVPSWPPAFSTGFKNVLFGSSVYAGLASAERIAASAYTGDNIKPADVTFDFAKDVVTSAIANTISMGIVVGGAKVSLEISETIAGLLGGSVLSVFEYTNTASHGEDTMHGSGVTGGSDTPSPRTIGGVVEGGGIHPGLQEGDVIICDEPGCMPGGHGIVGDSGVHLSPRIVRNKKKPKKVVSHPS